MLAGTLKPNSIIGVPACKTCVKNIGMLGFGTKCPSIIVETVSMSRTPSNHEHCTISRQRKPPLVLGGLLHLAQVFRVSCHTQRHESHYQSSMRPLRMLFVQQESEVCRAQSITATIVIQSSTCSINVAGSRTRLNTALSVAHMQPVTSGASQTCYCLADSGLTCRQRSL